MYKIIIIVSIVLIAVCSYLAKDAQGFSYVVAVPILLIEQAYAKLPAIAKKTRSDLQGRQASFLFPL